MENTEIERKFIIKKPSIDTIASMESYSESEILQIYIEDEKLTHRVRKRVYKNGACEYTENTKSRINAMSAVECENEITCELFDELSKNMEKGARPLLKIRRTFAYLDKIFEIDEYPEWKNTCIMEVELMSEEEKTEFPPFIEVMREVTGERAYSNHSMAHIMPKEDSI